MQRAQQQPVGVKYGTLFKCSSKLKLWASAWFVLGAQDLTYYKRSTDPPKIIDLQQAVSIVAADVEDAKRPHSFKVSSPSFPRVLILAAETSEQADEWIAAIRAVASLYAPPPETPGGPPKLTQDQKNMLEFTTQIVQTTSKLVSAASQCTVAAVYSKIILDSLSASALMCGTTARVVVYKPKVQSGAQRFNNTIAEIQALLIKYKHTFQAARKRAGVNNIKGKESDPLLSVLEPLQSLIEIMERTIKAWMPQVLDADLTKALEEFTPQDEEEEEEGEGEKIERRERTVSPYVSPFFVNPSASPPPCKKHWDLLVDECAGMITYMEKLSKGDNLLLKLPPSPILDQARAFLDLSKRLHDLPDAPSSSHEQFHTLTEEQFSLMKQQLMGSISSIDYHTANIGLVCNETVPPQIIDVISHSYGISSALSKLPRAIRKHRTKTLVSAVENIGSFSFSLSQLIIQMVDHENFLREPARGKQIFRDEVHAIQYIALHMLALCNTLVADDYRVTDILPFTDTAKLLALSVTNTLESIRHQLEMPRSHSLTPAKRKRTISGRKLASELTDATTGSMVFWFGLVGQEASIHLAA